MINFIYGRSASKKSRFLTNMIAQSTKNGTRSFLIVPEQFAVGSERANLALLPASAQLHLEILNFSRLYNAVCRKYGGLEYNYITKPLRHVMMWQNLSELAPLLEVYGKYADGDASLCDMMLSAVDELKGGCITPAQLENAAKKLEQDSSLAKKLRDIALITSAFENSVSRAFTDAADDISKLDSMLAEHNFFEGADVYIDAFTSFTAAEYRVIDKIFSQAANVSITLQLDFPHQSTVYSASILDSEKKLKKSAERHGEYREIVLEDTKDEQNENIRILSDNIFTQTEKLIKSENGDKNGIYAYSCADPYAEAQAAASITLSLLRDGYRLRDIVVIMRNAESYRGIIEPAFERSGIPFYFSEKTDLSTTPIVKFILSALRIKIYNWRTTDVISHLKCGLYDIDTSELDLFEQYVTTWQIRGDKFTAGAFAMNPDGYTDVFTDRGIRILEKANAVREKLLSYLLPFFEELEADGSIQQKCRAIYRFLVASSVQKRLLALSAREKETGKVREAIDHEKTFEICCDALGALAEAMSDDGFDDEITTSELCELLAFYFSKTDMGTIPTSADQVIIGSASMLRADSPKCAVILGMCDGVFPAPVKDGGILSFYEKNILLGLDVKFSSTDKSAASDELMYLHRAVSMPRERLYLLTYSSSADGRKATPSLPFERARKMLTEAGDKETRVLTYDGRDMLSLTPSLRVALQYLPALKATAVGEVINECATKDEKLSSLINKSAPPVSDNECTLSKETTDVLYGTHLNLTQSRIDKFVNCNFNYYCSYILKLREEQISRFKANDIGTFIHHILEKLLSNIVTDSGISPSITVERIKQMTHDIVKDYISRISPAGVPTSARLGHLYKRLYNLSLLLICNIIEEFRHSAFRPKYFELNTNGKGNNPSCCEFELKNGTRVIFSGIIDRVDVLKLDDGKVYIRVVDYKTGTKQFALDDIKHGLNIQMLLYLFTLLNNNNQAFYNDLGSSSPQAAGVVYLSSNIPQLDTEDYEDAESIFEKAQKELTRSGLLIDDVDILKAMNDELSPYYLGGVKLKKDGSLSGNALTSAEKFDELKEEIDKTLTAISEKIISGSANAEPLAYGKNNPCEFCAMKPICRRPIK